MKELLSPAGSMEALKMAIMGGADAVYVGGKRFGARAFATNFSDEEMKEAIFLCHLHGVSLYVTINTMIYESEIFDVLSYISFLYKNHIDAIILSDVGLMKLCHECFPDLELHASTQTHIHNVEQIAMLKKLGVKRVVLARELSLEEIKRFPKDMDLEVFIHGALCISYSGQCLFSSLLLGRSGNRGECAQICRLPFSLLQDGNVMDTKGQYLLSTRDLNTSKRFFALLDSNIKSFKIEGRMKSPSYVYYTTKMYRNLIDQYELDGTCKVSDEQWKNVSVLFGRKFTEGKIFHAKDTEFMNQITSNHQGIFLGKVLEVTKHKIKIQLEEDLHQGDGIRFLPSDQGMIVNFLYDSKQKLVSSAQKGEIVFVDNKWDDSSFKTVRKTLDFCLEQSISKSEMPKIPITMDASITLAHGFSLKINDGEHCVERTEPIVFEAKTAPISRERVVELLGRFGNTPFVIQDFNIEMEDHLFISVRDLNEFRRRCVDELIQKRVEREKVREYSEKREMSTYSRSLHVSATAMNESQVEKLLSLNVNDIYVSDYSLYQKYQQKNVGFRFQRVEHQINRKDVSKAMIGELGNLSVCDQSSCCIDYFLNVANHASVDYFSSLGVKRICLSPELSKEEINNILKQFPNGNPCEVLVYGRLEAMVLNHCILRTNVNQDKICKVCKDGHSYALKDRNGAIYPMMMDENHCTHVYFHSVHNLLDEVADYYVKGIRNFRFDFFDETPKEIEQILLSFFEHLQV